MPELVFEALVCFVDDGAAGGWVEVDVERGHNTGEHVVGADDEEQLDYLAGREPGVERREGRVVGAWSLEYFRGEAEQNLSVGVKARRLDVAALDGGDLLVIDAECLGDADVLDPLVLCACVCGD